MAWPKWVQATVHCGLTGSRQDIADDLTVDVGESEVPTGVAEGELLVVEAKTVKHCGVEVVDAGWVFSGFKADVVSGSVDCSAFDTAAGQPGAEAPVVVVAA